MAVSANFLSAPDPGEVLLITGIRKRGRRIGLVDVELVQGDRACVHAVVTLANPEHLVEPLFTDTAVADLMSVDPLPTCWRSGPAIPPPRSTTWPGAVTSVRVMDSVSAGQAPPFRSGSVPARASSTSCSR